MRSPKWQLLLSLFLATVTLVVTQDAPPKMSMAMMGFHQAISKDDQEGIRRAVAAGADVNFIGSGGQTALLNSVLREKVETVKTLLDLGADVTIPEKVRYKIYAICYMLQTFFVLRWVRILTGVSNTLKTSFSCPSCFLTILLSFFVA